jgi:hypothetical protein
MNLIRNEAGANGTVAGTKSIRRAHMTSSAVAGVHALTPSENNQAHSLNDSWPPGILAHECPKVAAQSGPRYAAFYWREHAARRFEDLSCRVRAAHRSIPGATALSGYRSGSGSRVNESAR